MIRHLQPAVAAVAILFTTALLPPDSAAAQIRASERATVSQTVDGTVIALDYSRPQAKGRSPLLGSVVRWDRPWTGANEATVLELNRDVTIQGTEVPAGRWSVWLVPTEDGPWEMFLDPRDGLWHTARPGPSDEQIRFPVEASLQGDHVEALTWSFPRVAQDAATLTLAWGSMRVPLEVEVEPSLETTITADRARPYSGSWSVQLQLPGIADDPVPFDIVYDDDNEELRAHTLYPTPEGELAETELLLIPRAEGIFQPAILVEGELFDTAAYLYLEFEFDDDRPTGLLLRWAADDSVVGEGRPAG